MDALHELITNMSMAERSYFKRYAAKLSDDASTNYTLLFDAIAAQNDYDEALLKKTFAREKFVKQFSVAKLYLYKTIIKALKNFYEESNVQSQLKHLQLELAVLMDKGIYAYAAKVIGKGVKLSEEFEMFSDLSEFLTAELYLLMNNHGRTNAKRNVVSIIDEQKQLSSKIQNLVEFENLYQQQHYLNKSVYQLREPAQLKAYETIFKNKLLRNPANALSHRALYYFHYIRALHFSVTDKRNEFRAESNLLVELCFRSKYFYQFDLRACMNALNLRLEAAYFSQDWKTMNATLKRLKELPVKSQRDKIAQFIYYSRFGLIYFDQQKDENAKMQLIRESWVNMHRYQQKIPYHVKISSIVTYTSALIETGEYAKALDWIELYRQGKKEDDARVDSQSYLLMMQLIAHYELKNYLLVKNIIPNISRFIRKVGQQGNFEKILFGFFNKLTASRHADTPVFEETLRELGKLKQGDILNRNRTMHDIFKTFIESKKAGKKYHEWLAVAVE